MLFYRALSRRWPYTVAFATCYVKGSAADGVAQLVLERRTLADTDEANRFNWRRNCAFALFSGAYLGCGQHVVYNVLFTRWFGPAQTIAVGLKKSAADSLWHVPFLYLPLYYAFEHPMIYGGTPLDGLRRYFLGADGGKPEIIDTCVNYWKIWPLFHFVNFTLTPLELRISTIACVSFAWLVVLSSISHRYTQEAETHNDVAILSSLREKGKEHNESLPNETVMTGIASCL
jgi:protein Mpv17